MFEETKKEEQKDELFYLVEPISSVLKAPAVNWVISDLFAKQNVSFLYGEAGCGKTWIILDLLLKLSLGKEILDGIETEPCKVLLLEGDTTDSLIKSRLEKFHNKETVFSLNNFLYVNKYIVESQNTEINLTTPQGKRNLAKCIESSKCDLVVIDTLISFINNECDQVEMQQVMSFIRQLAYNNNCHIMLCHHTRKKDTKDKSSQLTQSDMIGSSVLNRLASCIIAAERIETSSEELRGKLKIVKTWYKNINPVTYSLEGNEEESILKMKYTTEEEQEGNLQKTKELIKRFIKTNNIQSFTRKDITEKYSEVSISRIKKALCSLEEEGYIEATGKTNNRVFNVIPPDNEPNTL